MTLRQANKMYEKMFKGKKYDEQQVQATQMEVHNMGMKCSANRTRKVIKEIAHEDMIFQKCEFFDFLKKMKIFEFSYTEADCKGGETSDVEDLSSL